MKVVWDMHEFEDFAKKLSDLRNFESAIMTATKEVSKVLHSYLLKNTPVDTGNLRKMWSAGDNLSFTVEPLYGGYQVTFINEAVNKRSLSDNYPDGFMYGRAVNDGHRSKSGKWVTGQFFVEKSLIQLNESKRLESLIYNELQKWWKECLS